MFKSHFQRPVYGLGFLPIAQLVVLESVNARRGFHDFSHTVLPDRSRSLLQSTTNRIRAFGLYPGYICCGFHCSSVASGLLFSFSMLFLRFCLFCPRYPPSLVVYGSGHLQVSSSGHLRVSVCVKKTPAGHANMSCYKVHEKHKLQSRSSFRYLFQIYKKLCGAFYNRPIKLN